MSKAKRDYRDDETIKNLNDFRWSVTEVAGIACGQIKDVDYGGNKVTASLRLCACLMMIIFTLVTGGCLWGILALIIYAPIVIFFIVLGLVGLWGFSFGFYKLSMGADKVSEMVDKVKEVADENKTDI
jgi:hypothetical protein